MSRGALRPDGSSPTIKIVERPPLNLGVCARCAQGIDAQRHDYVYRQCSHHLHGECHAVLTLAGITKCTNDACSKNANTSSSRIVDNGCDTHFRALVMNELDQQQTRQQTTNIELPNECGGWPVPESSPIANILSFFQRNNRETASNDDEPPTEPLQGRVCRERTCGGPTYCVHQWLRPIDADAAYSLLTSDAASSLGAMSDDIDCAKRVIHRLLALPVSPATLKRCGADWPRLVAVDVHLDELVQCYDLEELIDGLELDWHALLALGFTPFSLIDRDHYPLVVLCEHPSIRLCASTLLRYFPLRYDDLTRALQLNVDDLLALNMDAALQLVLGMTERDIVETCASALVTRSDRGVVWYYSTFRWSFALAQKRPLANYRQNKSAALRKAASEFARLYVAELHA